MNFALYVAKYMSLSSVWIKSFFFHIWGKISRPQMFLLTVKVSKTLAALKTLGQLTP